MKERSNHNIKIIENEIENSYVTSHNANNYTCLI